jgi:solute carrier family 25 uncoupling protein 8/9
LFAGIRIGMYIPVRNVIAGELKPGENPTLLVKIAAGLATGAIGICIANPTDVVKVRLQAQGRATNPSQVKYTGAFDCYKKTIAADGVRGLWVGIVPNIMRNSVINAAELATYDQYKQMFLQYTRLPDNMGLHFICAFMAGFSACCVGSPFDVVKTRMMNKAVNYTGFLDCVFKTLKNEGPLAFYNGFSANFMRIGTWNIVMFVTLEQVKGYMFPGQGKSGH